MARVLRRPALGRRAAGVGERQARAPATHRVGRRRHGERPGGLPGGDRRDSPPMGRRLQTQLGRGRRDGGHARAARRHARVEERRTRRRFVVVMPAADVRWLASPGLVRRGGERVPGGSHGCGAARDEPDGSEPLRRARAGGARVEPAGRARDRATGSTGLSTTVTVSAQSVDSLLLIVPPEPATAAGVSPDTVVAGLPLLRRIVLAGSRAGFSRVLVQSGHDGVERLLGGTAASELGARPTLDSRRRIVILPANVVPQARWLRALRETDVEPERLSADGQLAAVIDTDGPSAVLAAAAQCRGDGELARLKFMESARGAILDFWGDNVVHVGVFACMAVGLSFAQGATWPLALGALTVVATAGSAACQSRDIMLDTAVGGDAAWIARVAEAISHRDFIYLVIVLSAFGKAHWFLILASIGTPIFFLLMLWVLARRRA